MYKKTLSQLVPFFLFLRCFFFSFLSAEEKVISGHIEKGQLGNQLFVVAATLGHAWDNGAKAVFPDFNRVTPFSDLFSVAFNFKHIFFRLDTSPTPYEYVFESPSPFYTGQIPFQNYQKLSGCFQSLHLFHHHRDKILSLLEPSQEINTYLNEKYGDLLQKKNTVAVHVRTYNECCLTWGLPFLGLKYYKKALSLFPKKSTFVVFSDRINWCEHHFKQFKGYSFVFIKDNNPIQDLFLMSKMDDHIISNSTFAWWGAYLNPKKKKKVVYPYYWFNPKIGDELHTHPNLFLRKWISVKPDLEEPYPTDIRDYDDSSKSVDTQ